MGLSLFPSSRSRWPSCGLLPRQAPPRREVEPSLNCKFFFVGTTFSVASLNSILQRRPSPWLDTMPQALWLRVGNSFNRSAFLFAFFFPRSLIAFSRFFHHLLGESFQDQEPLFEPQDQTAILIMMRSVSSSSDFKRARSLMFSPIYRCSHKICTLWSVPSGPWPASLNHTCIEPVSVSSMYGGWTSTFHPSCLGTPKINLSRET